MDGGIAVIRWLALGCVAWCGASGLARAQEACSRHGRAVCVSEAAGVLLKAEGDVRRSRGIGFNTISPGDDLIAGDRLIVRQGSALIGLSAACQLPVSANSLVSFTHGDKGFCAHGLFVSEGGGSRAPASPR